MFTNFKYPPCICGAKDRWEGGGCHISSSFAQSGGHCPVCKRDAEFLSHAGGALFLIVQAEGGKFTDAHTKWINDTMFTLWRVNEEKAEQAREALMAPVIAAFRQEQGLPENSTWRDWSEEVMAKWRPRCGELMDSPAYRKPAGCERSPLPVKLPYSLCAHIGVSVDGELTWELVDHNVTLDLTMPEDPILTHHKAYFEGVFVTVGKALGGDLPARTVVPNQYMEDCSKIEPWYTFPWHGHTITVGPRKRVSVIEVSHPSTRTRALFELLGKQDRVTYYENGIHAWGRDKLVEYMTSVLKDLQPA